MAVPATREGSEVRRSPSISAWAAEDGIAVQDDHVAADDALQPDPAVDQEHVVLDRPGDHHRAPEGHDVVLDLAPRHVGPPADQQRRRFVVELDEVTRGQHENGHGGQDREPSRQEERRE